jgi:hypothetical protein
MNHELLTMNAQSSHLLMIRPVKFGFNEQTAESNAFQTPGADQHEVQAKALAEFDGFVQIVKDNGVDVTVIEDTEEPHKPDAIFPNNWVSLHENGDVFLYPMQAENRRLERREDIIRKLEDKFKVNHIIDLSRFEKQQKFLEGTGSMVLDRENKRAYACISPRTDEEVLTTFCDHTGYRPVVFNAVDQNGKAIYHTNVLMAVAAKYVVICLDAITDDEKAETVIDSISGSGKEIIAISLEQMNQFAGNMLEIYNDKGESLIVMSASAWQSLSEEQQEFLSGFSQPVYADIKTIEQNGGGSARCMMAEVWLPLADS